MEKMRIVTLLAAAVTFSSILTYGAEIYLNEMSQSLTSTINKMWKLKQLMESVPCCKNEAGSKKESCCRKEGCTSTCDEDLDFKSSVPKLLKEKLNFSGKRGSFESGASMDLPSTIPGPKKPLEKCKSPPCEKTTNMISEDLEDTSNGWLISGCSGSVYVTLKEPIIISEFSMKPPPPHIELSHAPKEFTVLGHKTVGSSDGVPLGTYEFNIKKVCQQRFTVSNKCKDPFQVVQLKIHSNHGGRNFTCVNGFGVYGKPSCLSRE